MSGSPTGKALYLQAGFFKFKRTIAGNLTKTSETNENNSEKSQNIHTFSPDLENKTTENENFIKFLSPQPQKRCSPALSNTSLESLAKNQINLLANERKQPVSKEKAVEFEEKKENLLKNKEKKPFYRKKCSSILSTNQKIEVENENILKIFPNMTTIMSLKSLFHFEQSQIKSEKAGFLTKNELISSNVLQKAIYKKVSQISPQEKT